MSLYFPLIHPLPLQALRMELDERDRASAVTVAIQFVAVRRGTAAITPFSR
jgi:hypothetical protein